MRYLRNTRFLNLNLYDSILQLIRGFLMQNFKIPFNSWNLHSGILDVRFKFANDNHA